MIPHCGTPAISRLPACTLPAVGPWAAPSFPSLPHSIMEDHGRSWKRDLRLTHKSKITRRGFSGAARNRNHAGQTVFSKVLISGTGHPGDTPHRVCIGRHIGAFQYDGAHPGIACEKVQKSLVDLRGDGVPQEELSLLAGQGHLQCRDFNALIAHTTIVFMWYMFVAYNCRLEIDQRTFGELFYACCDKIRDISFIESLNRILSLAVNQLNRLETFCEKAVQAFFETVIEAALFVQL